MKKKTVILVSAVAILAVAGGGYGIYRLVKSNAAPVEVTSVSSLNSGYWGYSEQTTGIITSNATQDVYLSDSDVIDTVFVEEGDEVKVGDKLLAYDTTLLELDLEAEKLEKQSIQLQIKSAQQDLEKLKKITPVPDNYFGDAGSDAVLVKNQTVLTSTMSETTSGTEPEATQAVETPVSEAPAQPGEPVTEAAGAVEETEGSPLGKIKAAGKLNFDSKPYKGSGTKEDPYLFFCKEGTTIYASFMNKMLGYNEAGTSKKKGGMNKDGKGSYAVLEIREGDSVNGGFVKSISINGTVKSDKAYAPDITWTFGSDGITKNVPEVDEPADEPDDDDIWGDDIGGFGDDVYTASELKQEIKDKEDEIKDLKLDLREAKLSVKQAQRKLDEATVTATINGVVKAVGDAAVGSVDGEAFISVTSSEGMYVRGTISELKLGDVQVGTAMTGFSYESGVSFTATITEISEYPDTSDTYWYSGEALASKYPFMAYIEDSQGLGNNEYVELSVDTGDAEEDSSAIYLYKAYIRSENGQSYVYKADENDRLVKQYIKTGATLYSTQVEIKGGLTLEDKIAFPYGKNVKEGARVKADDDDEMDELGGETGW